jgi:AbrB family looped-hinge helix DNA binding protein
VTYDITLTTKGQLTLPVDIRRALKLNAGDKISVKQEGSDIRLMPKSRAGRFAKHRGIGTPGIGPGGRKAIQKYLRDLRGEW